MKVRNGLTPEPSLRHLPEICGLRSRALRDPDSPQVPGARSQP